ncbi:MAG: hypothetical protein MPJ24_02055 [Pirellulaceae bacterium]|nr:hypothetical protein [Pirellulaceae bacterium]
MSEIPEISEEMFHDSDHHIDRLYPRLAEGGNGKGYDAPLTPLGPVKKVYTVEEPMRDQKEYIDSQEEYEKYLKEREKKAENLHNKKHTKDKNLDSVEEKFENLRIRFSKVGVTTARSLLEESFERNYTYEILEDLLNYYHKHAGAWRAGALYWRIAKIDPEVPIEEGWPPMNPEFLAIEKMNKRKATLQKALADRAEGEKRREKIQSAQNNLEEKYGATLDKMSRKDLCEIGKLAFSDSPFYYKRLSERGAKGVVRTLLLKYFQENENP